jgi:hypothetical protein
MCHHVHCQMNNKDFRFPYNSMEMRTSQDATSSATTLEIASILCNLGEGVHYHIHKSSPLVPIMSLDNPVHTITPRSTLILSAHLHLGLPSPGDLLPSNFLTNNLYAFLFSPIHATCLTHLILKLIILTTLGEDYKLRSSSLYSFLHPPLLHLSSVKIFSSVFKADVSYSILFQPGFHRPS